GFAANIDLANLDGSNGFSISGTTSASEHIGTSVSSAGDINGDGYDDMIIGAPSAGHLSAGITYILYGKASGFASDVSLATLALGQDFSLRGEGANDESGHAVSSAGDVNGDGFDDMLIGAYGAGGTGNQSPGVSYLVFGRTADFPTRSSLSILNGVNGFRF